MCLTWVAVPVLRGEPSGPLGWHSGTQGRWGVLAAGQHGEEAALSSALTASEKWVRTANTLPAFALSKLGLASEEVKN